VKEKEKKKNIMTGKVNLENKENQKKSTTLKIQTTKSVKKMRRRRKMMNMV
jgi:hypothetical protein